MIDVACWPCRHVTDFIYQVAIFYFLISPLIFRYFWRYFWRYFLEKRCCYLSTLGLLLHAMYYMYCLYFVFFSWNYSLPLWCGKGKGQLCHASGSPNSTARKGAALPLEEGDFKIQNKYPVGSFFPGLINLSFQSDPYVERKHRILHQLGFNIQYKW